MPLFTYKCTACSLMTEMLGDNQETIICQCGATVKREYKAPLVVMGQGSSLVDVYDRDADEMEN